MASNTPSRPGTWDSTVTGVENSTHPLGFSGKSAAEIHKRLGNEAQHTTIGPMPVETFLDVFMKRKTIKKHRPMPTVKKDLFKKLANAGLEKDMYDPLVDALNGGSEEGSPYCTGFTFRITAYHPDTRHGTKASFKPDICCYSVENLEAVKIKKPSSNTPSKYASQTSMRLAALCFELKRTAALDFFRDPGPSQDRSKWQFVFHKDAQKAYAAAKMDLAQAFGQHVAYATEICARQHRQCCYSISLAGTVARLIRWDRAGAIVTTPFDLLRSPSTLCEFLWCFGLIGDADRGYDATIKAVTDDEQRLFATAIRRHIAYQLAHITEAECEAAFNSHHEPGAISAVELPDPARRPLGILRLLISRPMCFPKSPAGRGTRGYWAVDTQSHNVYFLKDTWRYSRHITGYENEGSLINKLLSQMVPNVPRVVCHADVLDTKAFFEKCEDGTYRSLIRETSKVQRTRTQEYLHPRPAPWVCGTGSPRGPGKVLVRITEHTHYRLVLGQAGCPLIHTFTGTKELLKISYDVFKAMWAANQTDDKIVHRDISPSNIIVYRSSAQNSPGSVQTAQPHDERKGYLVDWDLACPAEMTFDDRNPPYSAAWAFTSASIAKGLIPRPYEVKYDMESLLYVVLYNSILYLPHNQDAVTVRWTITQMFDFQGSPSGEPLGGTGKDNNMDERRYTKLFRWNIVLDDWLNTMMNYMAPLPEFGGLKDGVHRWTPEHVNAFWSKILEGPIVNGDRTPLFPDLQEDASQYLSGPPFEATMTAPPPTHLTKRTYERMIGVIDGLHLVTATRTTSSIQNTPRTASDSPPPAKKSRGADIASSSASTAFVGRLIAPPSTSSRGGSSEPLPPAVTLSSASGVSSYITQGSESVPLGGEAGRGYRSNWLHLLKFKKDKK